MFIHAQYSAQRTVVPRDEIGSGVGLVNDTVYVLNDEEVLQEFTTLEQGVTPVSCFGGAT